MLSLANFRWSGFGRGLSNLTPHGLLPLEAKHVWVNETQETVFLMSTICLWLAQALQRSSWLASRPSLAGGRGWDFGDLGKKAQKNLERWPKRTCQPNKAVLVPYIPKIRRARWLPVHLRPRKVWVRPNSVAFSPPTISFSYKGKKLPMIQK